MLNLLTTSASNELDLVIPKRCKMDPKCQPRQEFSTPRQNCCVSQMPQSPKFSCCWRKNLVMVAALVLVLFASGVSSGIMPNVEEEAASRKEFSVSRLHEMLKDLFKKQKSELWERMFEERGGGEVVRGEENGGRHRRNADVEKKLLSMEQEDRLGTFIGEVMACQNIPGLSLGMVHGGAGQGQGYGVADMETGRPVDRDTLFGIGSNTKAFAAASMAHLMASLPPEERFSFSTPLSEILEDIELTDTTRTEQTTLMDVLSHRTGLASGDLGLFSGYPVNMTTQDMCRRLKFLPVMTPFRSAWYYSNTLLVLVSRVCEVKAGKNWTELLEEAILGPLQMNTTFLTPEALLRDNVALPYILRMRVVDMFVQQDSRLFDIHPLQAAGAILTSAVDMTKWMAHLLQAIKRPSGLAMTFLRQIFTERTLLPAYLRQLASVETAEPILHIGYAMGFMTSYYKGHLVHWHTGDFHGYNSYVLLVPDLDLAVSVAVNGPSGPTTGKAVLHITYFVLELLQGHDPWVNLTLGCPELAEDVDPTPDPFDYDYDYPGDDALEINANNQVLLRPIEDYLGVFGHGLFGDLTILREQERNSLLRMELGRLLVADLIPTDNEYIFKVAPRAPVADTKEWEIEHQITFKSKENAVISKKEEGDKMDLDKKDSKNETEVVEKEDKPPLDEVYVRWELETYVFERSVRFDTALDEDKEESEVEEEKEEEATTKGPEPSKQESSVGSSLGARIAADGFFKTAVLIMFFSTLVIWFD